MLATRESSDRVDTDTNTDTNTDTDTDLFAGLTFPVAPNTDIIIENKIPNGNVQVLLFLLFVKYS